MEEEGRGQREEEATVQDITTTRIQDSTTTTTVTTTRDQELQCTMKCTTWDITCLIRTCTNQW